MLSTLHIENIAVIEQAEIAFDSGFNVLTGETGAGKSIVIDAISAILGERASREMIRTGAQKAFVSAIFSGVPELPWFAENQIPYEPELGISREIFADGKNSCRVSGKPVTVSTLRKLGVQLIQIHGDALSCNALKLVGAGKGAFFAASAGGQAERAEQSQHQDC